MPCNEVTDFKLQSYKVAYFSPKTKGGCVLLKNYFVAKIWEKVIHDRIN